MIKFTTEAIYEGDSCEILDKIFDPSEWISFRGWGIVPGIKKAEIANTQEERLGTKFVVESTDGSIHEEIVTDYEPGRILTIKMSGFHAPLNLIATHFVETWKFKTVNGQTQIKRAFELHEKNLFGAFFLRIIGYCLRKAAEAHNEYIVGRVTDSPVTQDQRNA